MKQLWLGSYDENGNIQMQKLWKLYVCSAKGNMTKRGANITYMANFIRQLFEWTQCCNHGVTITADKFISVTQWSTIPP